MHNLFALSIADSEDPDEMPHYTEFHQGLHCLLRQKLSSEKKLQLYLEIVTCEPSNYTMDHFKFVASIQKEESNSTKRVMLITVSTACLEIL